MENTKIEWATHTWNPWEGCTKVSAGCANCYAENRNARFGGGTAPNWGKGAPRRRTSEANWREPLKWNREAEKSGTRPRVFCASLADVFDAEVPDEWRADLFRLIRDTPHLDWLLLTKRPENVVPMLHSAVRENSWSCDWAAGHAPVNVWLGASVENQEAADKRIPELMKIPAKVRFLSCEPLLGPVDLMWWIGYDDSDPFREIGIHWVIAGGESGPHARPMHPDWARSLRNQCSAAGVAFHFKQWGEHVSAWQVPSDEMGIVGACEASVLSKDGVQTIVFRAGKKRAGRLLDGRTWDEVPEVVR